MKRKMTNAEKDQFKRECLGIPADKKLSPEDQRFIDSYFQAIGILMRETDKKMANWRARGCPPEEDPKITTTAGITDLDARLRALTEGFHLTGGPVGRG